jgi:hypothetical protein
VLDPPLDSNESLHSRSGLGSLLVLILFSNYIFGALKNEKISVTCDFIF